MALLSWLAVLAVTLGAVAFGQSARAAALAYPAGELPSRVRTGIAVSICGPLVAAGTGVALAVLAGSWLLTAVATVVAVTASAALGLLLAPE